MSRPLILKEATGMCLPGHSRGRAEKNSHGKALESGRADSISPAAWYDCELVAGNLVGKENSRKVCEIATASATEKA
jgi:hypothetical protein